MISENIPEEHEKTRADLADKVAQFLAKGGEIHQCANRVSAPKEQSLAELPKIDSDLLKRARQAAKTMTQSEACAQLGVSRTTLQRLSKQHGFQFRVNSKSAGPRRARRQDPRLLPPQLQSRCRRQVARHQQSAAEQAGPAARYRFPQVAQNRMPQIRNRVRHGRRQQ